MIPRSGWENVAYGSSVAQWPTVKWPEGQHPPSHQKSAENIENPWPHTISIRNYQKSQETSGARVFLTSRSAFLVDLAAESGLLAGGDALPRAWFHAICLWMCHMPRDNGRSLVQSANPILERRLMKLFSGLRCWRSDSAWWEFDAILSIIWLVLSEVFFRTTVICQCHAQPPSPQTRCLVG